MVSPKSCEMLLVMAAVAVDDAAAAEGVRGGESDDAADGGEAICGGEWSDI